ncbi:MAG: hypothetical protein U5K54_24570 [Cytophagales bacterium]|nr:hypothetical protein [Cytophagales bacterium]
MDKVIRLKPDTVLAYFTQGLVFTKMREFNKALTAFEKAESMDSNNVDYLVNHATVQYYLGKYDVAKEELSRAVKIRPEESNIYNTLSLIEIEQANYSQALELV